MIDKARIPIGQHSGLWSPRRYFQVIHMKVCIALLAGLFASVIACQGHSTQPNSEDGQTNTVQTSDTSAQYIHTQAFTLSDVHYTAADSVRVCQLLVKPMTGSTGSDVLFFARQFIGIPYVAHTLEVADPERLVVNLRQMDCTTLVETVLALTLTKRQGSSSFTDFCQNLMNIRYRKGVMRGYLSRLHYFTWWMHDAEQKGILFDSCNGQPHATKPIVIDNHYMSSHHEAYKILRNHPEWVDSIRSMELAENGPDGYYIPEKFTALDRSKLTEVHDGDIVAIVTTKPGLDYSHLGFAAWGKDGQLHLLNASMVYKRVVEDKVTLFNYLQKRKTSIGIRTLRLR